MGKRLITQKRGGARPRYISPSHRHVEDIRHPQRTGDARVIDLVHAPGRTTPLALVRFEDGLEQYVLPQEGLRVGSTLRFLREQTMAIGDTTIVSKIPTGMPIFNIEGSPGDGGKYIRAAGAFATVIGHTPTGTVIQLRSGQLKTMHPECRATIGNVAGGGRGDKPWMKAGKKWWGLRSMAQRWPNVRGTAMNPVAHPHGGGSHNYPGKPTSMARGTPPGRNVGKIAPKRTGRKKV
jgi:large subunit ribosomal protein L2